ncbi:MAG: GtrA family protein [Pseudomonadota bacterium]|uniref:GtrA family protein n=1 Tax=Burkholderia sp. 4M9327F10 TaxID=2502223 RepID=UPI0010F5EA95|nr:GtrA family protein [Burkholderia sp. 4M9327F10]
MKQFVRFLLVGLFNTGFGYCIIFFFMYAIKFSPEISNVLGYAIALAGSYVLNRKFTFESNKKRTGEIFKFLVVFSIAYSANFAFLVFLIHIVNFNKGLSQILAGVLYVGVSFFMNKYYVFKAPISS